VSVIQSRDVTKEHKGRARGEKRKDRDHNQRLTKVEVCHRRQNSARLEAPNCEGAKEGYWPVKLMGLGGEPELTMLASWPPGETKHFGASNKGRK